MNMRKFLLGVAGLIMLSAAPASAYTITAEEYLTGGGITAGPFGPCVAAAGTKACATLTYTGPLNFSNTAPQNNTNAGDLNSAFFIGADISGYVGSGSVTAANADWSTQTNFLNSSGSIAGEAYGSLYSIDLGTIYAGTLITITHDDGVALYDNGTLFGGMTAGPTSAVTESATVGTAGDIMLYYTRQNGTPSILQVTVPEPASIAVFGAALICMAGMAGWMRRSRASV